MPNDALRAGFRRWGMRLRERTERVGGMEISCYRLTARE
jgi:hypothetical protein